MRKSFKQISFAMVLVLLFPIMASAATVKIPDTRSITIYKIEGAADGVTITRGAKKTFKAVDGTKLAENDTVTTDSKTSVYFSIDDDKVVKLDKNTKVTISKASSAKLRITLVSGSVYFDLKKPVSDGKSVEFKTGGTVMGVRGTDGFIMNEGGESKVALLTGAVEMKTAGGQTILLGGGQYQILNVDGTPQGAPLDIDLQTMPSFVLETIIERLTETPANAEEAAKIEQIKEALNLKNDADIAALRTQAEQTKAAEQQQQQQQQQQQDQAITTLSETAQASIPAPPPATGGTGGGGSGLGGGGQYGQVEAVSGINIIVPQPGDMPRLVFEKPSDISNIDHFLVQFNEYEFYGGIETEHDYYDYEEQKYYYAVRMDIEATFLLVHDLIEDNEMLISSVTVHTIGKAGYADSSNTESNINFTITVEGTSVGGFTATKASISTTQSSITITGAGLDSDSYVFAMSSSSALTAGYYIHQNADATGITWEYEHDAGSPESWFADSNYVWVWKILDYSEEGLTITLTGSYYQIQ